ncbi:LppA family lipoprotein [Actinotalea sp. C106]|uniref:LppA family lipoprotein n=1 Tax=Actinotalea sp. C106 TaxID=2908644 RepID=UPI00202821F8|nr:LppA family lipoprotein [Actinotalea sp. C106]
MTKQHRWWGAVTLALAAAVGGCAAQGGSQGEEEVTTDARPSMEQVLDSYEAMQVEIVEALEADPGGLVWEADQEGFGLTRSGCPEVSAEAETATFRGLLARGSYEGEDRARFLEVVEEISARHGFSEVTTVVDRPDGVRRVAEDEFGGRVYFGTAASTTLLVMTGCHEWESTPGEDDDRPSVIDPPDATPAPTPTPDA